MWISTISALSVIAMMCLSSGGKAAADSESLDDGCRSVRAEINLATGTIAGNFGLEGTVVFVADSNGSPPPTAPANASVFSGILTITTARGVLEMRETGMFSSRIGNPAGPILSSWGDVVGGTGRYSDVSGEVFFGGRRVGNALIVIMLGELCR